VATKIRNTARNFHAPVLPNPPAEYSQALTHQRDATLRFYFQNIDEALSQALQYDTSDIIDGSIPNSKLENSTVSFGGVTLSLGGVDATPAFNLVDATGYLTSNLTGTITNAQLAGSIANAKLVNDSVSYGGVSLDLGQTDATPAFDLSDATNYPTSSLSGTITNAQLAGSIANAKLSNSTVSYGGIQLALGASDATPAFNLSDATDYPTSSLSGTIATAQIADDAVTDAKLADAINSAITANTAKVTNATHSGEVTGATALTIADGAVVTARIADANVTTAKIADANVTTAKIADDAVTDAKLANSINTAITANTAKVTNATHTGEVTGATALTIADDAVVTARIADDAVTGAKIDGATTVTVAEVVVTPDSGNAASTLKLKASNNYTANLHFGDVADDDAGRIEYNNYSNTMGFYINNSQKAIFKSDGDLLLGTTSSGSYSAKLRVAGITESTGLRITSNANQFLQAGYFGSAGIELRSFTSYSSSAQLIMKFANSTGTEFGSIKITGASTSFNTSSDERLKENIRDADDAGAKIDAIKIRQFDWKISGEHQDYGFVAQELLPVAPEAVSEGYTADDMMSVDYSKLVPTLVKEIQSLRKRVEELENDK